MTMIQSIVTECTFFYTMEKESDSPQEQPQKGQNQKDYSKLTHEQLCKLAVKLEAENKRLKGRLAEHEPYKQKILKGSNEAKMKRLFDRFKVRKYALKVCYIGANYDGMSCQNPNDNSVEEYIFKVMHAMSLIPQAYPADPSFTRAGRTDKGVSAMGNVIALNLRTNEPKVTQNEKIPVRPMEYCKMLNNLLPQDIRMVGCEQVHPDFNARYWCTSRKYKYFFARGCLDLEAMGVAIRHFEGTHNFINYCKMNLSNTVNFERTIHSATIVKAPCQPPLSQQDNSHQIYYFYFIGNSFLWHQIRNMSAVLFLVGHHRQQPSLVADLLNTEMYPRKPNYHMAADYPLILEDCLYDDLEWKSTDPEVITSFTHCFNEMVYQRSVQQVLLINCMLMAEQQLLTNHTISQEAFRQGVAEHRRAAMAKAGAKQLQMHKSSGRGLEEAVNSLKGKKKELYLKKLEKQKEWDEKVRQQKEAQRKQQNGEQSDQKQQQ